MGETPGSPMSPLLAGGCVARTVQEPLVRVAMLLASPSGRAGPAGQSPTQRQMASGWTQLTTRSPAPKLRNVSLALVSRGGFSLADHRREPGSGRGARRKAGSETLCERCPRVNPRGGGGAGRTSPLLGDL